MKVLSSYIALDLEFNQANGIEEIIQLSAVKMINHEEVEQFDTYVYTDTPLQSFINGLTGITADKVATAPEISQVIASFADFVGDLPLIGYNAQKSDLPLLLEEGLDLTSHYQVDVYDEAFERRSTDLNGIINLKLTSVADFLAIKGRGHNSLEDARMTAKVYEAFLELDANKAYLSQQEQVTTDNPFAALGGFWE
ncbi:3'-5' exonuclease [Streptococcus moroccensis]|uniref:DNA polymerase-3 subunit epsilon n=1 Tax=Streptococcus moroccensis TaxID=1451356 RepID=A0ABT9YSI0_9STRE|nr:3'-5' exonuclease [Streptococcus moroccensis]MDQ0222940.1 DNA polymerase-3 subunit epsilon [Streptococcus moroccensis]